jgi:actin
MHGPPVVVDIGRESTKVGVATSSLPCMFPSMARGTRHPTVLSKFHKWTGPEEIDPLHPGDYKYDYPVKRGRMENLDAAVGLYSYGISKVLNVKEEEHPILISERSHTPLKERERHTQLVLEGMRVPGMYISNQAILSLYASGKTNGLVVESGYEMTECVPVFESYQVNSAIKENDISSQMYTKYFSSLLCCIKDAKGKVLKLSEDAIQKIKQECTYVAINEEKELEKRPAEIRCAYTLPDGKGITLGKERFQCSEVLFRPSLAGESCL